MAPTKVDILEDLKISFTGFILPRKVLVSNGMLKKLNYNAYDLAIIALNMIRATLRNAMYRGKDVELPGLGKFHVKGDQILFIESDALARKIKSGKSYQCPSWASWVGNDQHILDAELLIAITCRGLKPIWTGEPDIIGNAAFSIFLEALAWFISEHKKVLISGIGKFSINDNKILFEPDTILIESVSLGKRRPQWNTNFKVIRS